MRKTTSGGGVVLNQNGDVLVVSQFGTSWSLPKGHVEEAEDLMAAARREIEEETGVTDLEFIKELGSYQRHRINEKCVEDLSELKTITIFLFKTKAIDLKPLDPENPVARWVKKEEVADLLTHPKDKEFFLSIKDKIEG